MLKKNQKKPASSVQRGGICSAGIQTDARLSNVICRVCAATRRLSTSVLSRQKNKPEQTRPRRSLSLQTANTEWPPASMQIMQIVQIDVRCVWAFLFFCCLLFFFNSLHLPLLYRERRQGDGSKLVDHLVRCTELLKCFRPRLQWIRPAH